MVNSSSRINEKSRRLLKTLIEEYIRDGLPVGSKTLADKPEVTVSPATVRNIMADLEDFGYLTSPHTSAGRVPTPRGYRLFVDSLITVDPVDTYDLDSLNMKLDPDMSSQELVEKASDMLSAVTRMAGLVTIPRRDKVTLRHVDFLQLQGGRVLVILVLDEHEVQNRVIYTKETYTETQLREASNYINRNFSGEALGNVRAGLIASMRTDKKSMQDMMQTTLDVADQAFTQDSEGDFVVTGQENLITTSQALEDIRQLFQAFSMKGDILHLLDRCMETDGVQLFIGNESGYEVLDDLSVVTSSYQVDGQPVGVLGVIGPTRMAYGRVIPIVDATAKILSAALETGKGDRSGQ